MFVYIDRIVLRFTYNVKICLYFALFDCLSTTDKWFFLSLYAWNILCIFLCHLGDGWAWDWLMKVVASCDKPGRGACIFWTWDCRMRFLLLFIEWWSPFGGIGNLLNWNILVGRGRENNCDAVSNVERKRFRTNWILLGNLGGDVVL